MIELSKEDRQFFIDNGLDPDEAMSDYKKKNSVQKEDSILKSATLADETNNRISENASPAKPTGETKEAQSKTKKSVSGKIVDGAKAVVKDVSDTVTSPVDTSLSIGQGLINGVTSFGNFMGDTLNFAEEVTRFSNLAATGPGKAVGNFLNTEFGYNREEGFYSRPKDPDYDPAEDGFFGDKTVDFKNDFEFVKDEDQTWTQQIAEGLAQFAVGLKGIGKAGKITGVSEKLSKLSQTSNAVSKGTSIAKFVGANGIADMAAFSEEEPRFFDMMKNMGMENEFVEFMATNPKDDKSTARYKQFLEGMLLGGAFEGVFKSKAAAKKAAEFIGSTSEAFRQARVVKSSADDIAGVASKVDDKIGKAEKLSEADVKRTKPDEAKLKDDIANQDIAASMTERKRVLDDFRKFEGLKKGSKEADKILKKNEGNVKALKGDLAEAVVENEKVLTKVDDLKKLDHKKAQLEVNLMGFDSIEQHLKWLKNLENRPDADQIVRSRLSAQRYQEEMLKPKLQEALKAQDNDAIAKVYNEMKVVQDAMEQQIRPVGQVLGAENILKKSSSQELREFRLIKDFKEKGASNIEAFEAAKKVAEKAGVEEGVKFLDKIRRSGKPVSEIATSYYYANLLSNPMSAVVAGVEGTISAPFLKLSEYPAALINKAKGNKNGIQLNELNGFYSSYLKNFMPSLGVMYRSLFKGEIPDIPASAMARKLDEDGIRIVSKYADEGFLGVMAKMTDYLLTPGLKALGAADAGISYLSYNTSMRELAIREANNLLAEGKIGRDQFKETAEYYFKNPTDAMNSNVKSFIQDATLTAPLDNGTLLGKIDQSINSQPALQIALPFFRVSANIIEQTMRRTPIRMINLVTDAGGTVKKVKWDELTQVQRDKYKWDVMAGTGLMATAAMGYANNVMTGDRPTDFRKVAMLPPGWQPNSVRVGDTYISYNKMGVVGQLLKMGVAIGQGQEKARFYKQELDEDFYAPMFGAILVAVQKGMTPSMIVDNMAGLSQIIELKDFDKLDQKFSKKASGFIPASSLMRQITRITDDTKRSKLDFKDEDEFTAMEKEINSILPWKSRNLPERLDVFGDPMVSGMPIAIKAIVPFAGQKIKKEDKILHDKMLELGFVGNEFLDSSKQAGEKDFNMSFPRRSISFKTETMGKGKNVQLNPRQYNELIKYSAGIGLDRHPFSGTEYDGLTFKEMMVEQIELGFPFAEDAGKDPDRPKSQEWAFKEIYKSFKKAGREQLKRDYSFEFGIAAEEIDEQEKQWLGEE